MTVSARIVNPDPQSGYITVVLDGKSYSINAGNGLFAKALEAFKVNDWDAFIGCVNPEVRLKSLYAKYEGIEVKDGNLYVFGDPVHSTVATRVLSFLEAGFVHHSYRIHVSVTLPEQVYVMRTDALPV